MMYKVREFFKWMFVFEKTRYYYGGALMYPVRITQRFWDMMKDRREEYLKNLSDPNPLRVRGYDTNLGSIDADLGERPKVPDWIIKLRSDVLFFAFLVSIPVNIYLFLNSK